MTLGNGVQHYLSIGDLSAVDTWDLMRLAGRLKREHADGAMKPRLAGKTLAMIFQKPSLRTRVSFEAGMSELGGHAIYLGPSDIRLGERETVEDIALTLSRMSDVIMARVFGHDIVEALAQHATVPVINGLSDREHPCQVLADLLTIYEYKKTLERVRLAFVGDGNNVAHSLMLGASLMGMHCTVITPPGFEPREELLAEAESLAETGGGSVRVSNDPRDVRAADVVYTDVWTSMGQEEETEARTAAFRPYQVNETLMARARPDAMLLHCLPAHYGEEIDYSTSRRPGSAIFDQAENRLHAQKALLLMLVTKPAIAAQPPRSRQRRKVRHSEAGRALRR